MPRQPWTDKEIKAFQDRKVILSWDEIASAVAYPKVISDDVQVKNSNPDEYKLLHQAERISKIYISQMEEIFAELENVEMHITKHKYVSRCINALDQEDKEVIEQFVKQDLSFERGMQVFHVARSTLYKMQKRAIKNLTAIYNN